MPRGEDLWGLSQDLLEGLYSIYHLAWGTTWSPPVGPEGAAEEVCNFL